MTDYTWFVGIDWGTAEHQFAVVDATGRFCGTRAVPHTLEGVTAAVRWMRTLTGAPPATIAVGLETPRGLLVHTLLDQGFAVFAINPKQLDRFRDRFTAAGAKDDTRDAHVLADALRTDRRAFRCLQPDAPIIIELRELSRMVEDLGTDLRRLANRLTEQLHRVDAPWLAVCPAADEPWLWTLLAQTPHPDRWASLSRRDVARVLQRHRIRRLTAADLQQLARQPRLSAAAGVATAVAVRITSLVPQLQLLAEQRRRVERQIDHYLQQLGAPTEDDSEPSQHRDAVILQSLPGVGRMVTATMLTEATGSLSSGDYASLRALAGAAPVTKRSGKRLHLVQMRYACNARLRQALYHWARTSIQRDAAARAYYDQLRARGHTHGRALRSVADRWLRILVAMLKTRTLYDATRFQPNLAPCA